MTNAIDKELNTYIKLLDLGQKKSLLGMIKSFLLPAPPERNISIEEYNKEIADSESEIDRGECYTHDEVIRMSKSWASGK